MRNKIINDEVIQISVKEFGKEIFKEYYKDRVIEFNASDDRGINAVREKITNSAREYVSDVECSDGTKIPPYKIIVLDEADSMTDEAHRTIYMDRGYS